MFVFSSGIYIPLSLSLSLSLSFLHMDMDIDIDLVFSIWRRRPDDFFQGRDWEFGGKGSED